MSGKARYNCLIKSDSKKHPEGIDLQNMKNLGYEGHFWFGNLHKKCRLSLIRDQRWRGYFQRLVLKMIALSVQRNSRSTSQQNSKRTTRAGKFLSMAKEQLWVTSLKIESAFIIIPCVFTNSIS